MKLFVISACHNRRDLTVQAVLGAWEAAECAGLELVFTLFDDGSTDGTGEAVRALPCPATIIEGDGDAFWAKSMAIAEQHVLEQAADEDFVVWLNDDVDLDVDAFERAMAARPTRATAVLVGSMRDPRTGALTYGGHRLWNRRIHPIKTVIVEPTDTLQSIDTFNGNLVFFPAVVLRQYGGIDGAFIHAAGDIDIGLRFTKAGVPIYLLPGTYGSCPRNRIVHETPLEDWRRRLSVTGAGHPATLARLFRKHAPIIWPIYFATSQALWWLRRLTRQRETVG